MAVDKVTPEDLNSAAKNADKDAEEWKQRAADYKDLAANSTDEMGASLNRNAQQQAQQKAVAAMTRAQAMRNPEQGTALLTGERVMDKVRNGPLAKEMGRSELGEDFQRGLAQFFVSGRVALNDMTGDTQERDEWRNHLQNLRQYLPGSTGPKNTEGVRGFVSDASEGAGGMVPMILAGAAGGVPGVAGGTATGIGMASLAGMGASAYGSGVDEALNRASQMEQQANALEDENPHMAADLRAQAQSVREHYRDIAAAKAATEVGSEFIMPEWKVLRGGMGATRLGRAANIGGKSFLEGAAAETGNQIINHAAFGDSPDLTQVMRGGALEAASGAPMTVAGAMMPQQQTTDNDTLPPNEATGAAAQDQADGATAEAAPVGGGAGVAAVMNAGPGVPGLEEHTGDLTAEEVADMEGGEQGQNLFANKPRFPTSGLLNTALNVATGRQQGEMSAAVRGFLTPGAGAPSAAPLSQGTGKGAGAIFAPQAQASLQDAYHAATAGQSTAWLPLWQVFQQAQKRAPGLQPQDFLNQVRAAYDNGHVMLEGANSQQEVQAAQGWALHGTGVGVGIRMAMPQQQEGGRNFFAGAQNEGLSNGQTPGSLPADVQPPADFTDAEAADRVRRLEASLHSRGELPVGQKLLPAATDLPAQRAGELGFAKAFAGLFRRRIVALDGLGPQGWGGVINEKIPDTVFVNAATPRPLQVITGHELLHHLELSHPDLYARLDGLLAPEVKAMATARKQYAAYGDDTNIRREMYADLLGESVNDPKFWDRLSKREPGIFMPLARAVWGWFKGVLDALHQRGWSASPYFKDLQKAQEVLAQAMVEFARREHGMSPQQAEEAVRETLTQRDNFMEGKAAGGANETRARFASPGAADRVINGPRTDAIVSQEARQWLDSVDNETAVQAFVNHEVALAPDAQEHAAGLLIAHLSKMATEGKTEVQRMWNHVQAQRMARVWTREYLSADPARAMRQRAVVNNTILGPIAPVLAAQEVLEDRAKAVIDKRFDGGAEGGAEKVVKVVKKADVQAGEELAADLDAETNATPANPGAPPPVRKGRVRSKHVNLAKMLDALRNKMHPGMTWQDIFSELPSTQKERQRAIYSRLMRDERLKGLSADERLKLTNELDKAWQRERRKVFNRELQKAGVLGEKNASDRQKVQAATPRLLRLMNLGMMNSELFREAMAKEYGVKVIDAAKAAELRALGERIQNAPEGLPRRKLEVQLMERLQALSDSTLMQVLESWWTASVLSGWRTQVDIGLGLMNGVEDVGLGSLVTALRTGNADVAWRAITGLLHHVPDALGEAWDHLITGNKTLMRNAHIEAQQALEDGNRLSGDVGAELWRKGGWRKVPGAFMIFYGRLLAALDHINSTSTAEGAKMMALARHPELYQKALLISAADRAAARNQAKQEMLGGREPATLQERVEIKARAKEILDAGIPLEVIGEAREIGRQAALQGDPTGLGHALMVLVRGVVGVPGMMEKAMVKQGMDNPAAKAVMMALRFASTTGRVISGTKFIRTVAHGINRTVSYAPGIGLLRFAEGQMRGAQADILISKQITGTLVGLALLAMLRGHDDDEWGVEGGWNGRSAQEKGQLYAQGKQPYSVWYRNAQGKIVSFNYQQWGVAGVLSTLGSMEDERRYNGYNKADLNILINGIASGAMSWTDRAQLQGLQTVFDHSARSSDVGLSLASRLNKYLAGTVGGMIPRIAKDVDQVAHPALHDSSEWWMKWAQQVPMVRELSSGKRVDIFGKEVELDRTPTSRVFQLGTADPAYRLLGRLNERDIWLTDPSSGVRVVKMSDGQRRSMTPGEKDRYQRRTGEAYRDYILKHGEELLRMDGEKARDKMSRDTKLIRASAFSRAVR